MIVSKGRILQLKVEFCNYDIFLFTSRLKAIVSKARRENA